MSVEHGPMGGSERLSLIRKLRNLLDKMLMHKNIQRAVDIGEQAHRRQRQYETRARREEEERRREAEDRTRAYHEARSGQIEEVEVQLARAKRSQAVKDYLDEVIQNQDRVPEGGDYLIKVLGQHTDILKDLIDQNPAAAEAIYTFITKGKELHGSSVELIKEAQRLSYEAAKTAIGRSGQLNDLFSAISERVQELLWDELQTRRRVNRRQGIEGPNTVAELLEREPGIVMSDNEKMALGNIQRDGQNINWEATRTAWNQAIDTMIKTPREEVNRDTDWLREKVRPETKVAANAVPSVDIIWSEIERREKTGEIPLSVDELEDFRRKIQEAESKEFPKDVPANSAAYNAAVRSIRQYTEEKLNTLSEKLKERLRTQAPPVAEGIVDEDRFLKELARHKGRLGELLARNPEMERLFLGTGERSGRFRNRIFLKIHSSVINDQRNSSHDNFGLYERADFTSFVDLLRIGLGKIKIPETGESLGQAWADYYNNLSNAIRQSRDIDFFASQPAASIENFNKTLGMFQNEYTSHVMSIPAVVAAFRSYETVLRSIMSSNDGYIPPSLIEYNAAKKGSFWDQRAREMLKNMIAMGVIPDLARDPDTYLHKVEADGYTLCLGDPLNKHFPDDDEISMYMVLAKGFGMASARYLEMFANAKIPGSDHPERGIAGFRSIPYEGIARGLNYMSTFINKWKSGAYKYFYLFNQLVPRNKTISLGDSREAAEAYLLYQNDPEAFKKKFGPEAKRFIDSTNFSGISSAIGKETLWRQFDSTITLSDKQREWLGGPTRLALSYRYADEAIKNFLVVNKYREMYRSELIRRNEKEGTHFPTSGSGFDKLWREYGQAHYSGDIFRDWDAIRDVSPKKGKPHTKLSHEYQHLHHAFQTALKARIWVEMTMRNPLVVAHNVKVGIPRVGLEGEENKVSLHKKLINEILNIPPEDTKYGELYGKSSYGTSPTKKQEEYMIAVMQLEGDLAAVRELAIRECRDLTEEDFQKVIKDQTRAKHALTYWRRVREHMLGTADLNRAEELYRAFGLGVAENGDNYEWDYDKIHHLVKSDGGLSETVHDDKHQTIQLTKAFRDAAVSNPEWIMGTDDMAFGKMDMLNLGSRHWLRRGGDISGHWNGGNAMADYLVHGLVPNPDKHKLAEMLMKIRDAYSDDMIEAGWGVAANLAVMTDRFYSWDWKRLGSPAQLDVWRTRRNVAAWMANGRREFWDALEHMDVLPPHGHFYYYDVPEKTDIHTLRKMRHADNLDVIREIILLGGLLAIMITIYRGLTAPSEEEEGGHH